MASQGNVERTLGLLLGKLEAIEDRLERADESRAVIHRRLDDLVLRTTHVESDVMSTKSQINEMRSVHDDVVALRQKAEGAGTLGRWLIRIGIWIVSIGGWLIGVYTWVTGRPPP